MGLGRPETRPVYTTVGVRTPGEEFEPGSELYRIVVRDLSGQDAITQRPSHDLGSLLVAARPPIGRRRVPGPQAAELEEANALRPRHVLVDPDVSHLVEEVPAGRLIDEHRAHVDHTILGVTEVTAASGRVTVESDLDQRGIEARAIEPRHRPAGELSLSRVLRDHDDPGPELQTRRLSHVDGPASRKRRQREDRSSEPADGAHGRTVEPGA